uniref:Uncharacterized protein n=1 Tax=Cercocebus atys TaxID=9531 RepID=A0A2K5KP64_CERAT
MLNKCSFHSSIYKLAADNSASSLCAIICFLNLVIESDYLFSQNNRIRFSKLPLKILSYTSIFSYPELICEQYVTSTKFLSKSFKFQLLCMCW